MEALRRRRRELEQRTSLALASEAALEIAISKERTLALARTLGIATPRSVPLDDLRDVPAAVAEGRSAGHAKARPVVGRRPRFREPLLL